MQVQKARAKIGFSGMVETFLFPADKVKTYRDYLLLGGSPAFPTVRRNRAREISDQYEIEKNLVVNLGLGFIRDFLLQESPTLSSPVGPTHNSVGSGTNAPDPSDEDLQTQIQRLAITEWYSSGYAAKMDTFWPSPDGNGDWNETGLHNHESNASTLFCRKKFLATFEKTSGKTALVSWTITPVAA